MTNLIDSSYPVNNKTDNPFSYHHWKSGKTRCPVCQHRKNWSYLSSDTPNNPEFVICYGNHPPISGWKYISDATTGGRLYVREDHSFSESFFQSPPSFTLETPLVPVEIRHKVYSSLLKLFNANTEEKYRKQHQRRGFKSKDFKDQLLGYLPGNRGRIKLVKELCEELGMEPNDLEGIPGFFFNTRYNQWSLAGSAGLIIPVYNENGMIEALQIQPDSSRKGAKYLWLSSGNKEKGGVSSGAPAGVIFPKDWDHEKGDWSKVVLVEGYYKALSLRDYKNVPIVWLAGVGLVDSALQRLGETGVQSVEIIYDSDWRTNYQVRRSLARMAQSLKDYLACEVTALAWPSKLGKGIDDALLLNEMEINELQPIDLEQLIRSVEAETRAKSLRLKCDPKEDISFEPQNPLTTDELREKTKRAILQGLKLPAGTINLIMAGTNTSKTYSAALHALGKSIFVLPTYKNILEVRDLLRNEFNKEAEIYFGRQAPPGERPVEGSDDQLDEYDLRVLRWESAGCPRYDEASKAGQFLHNPCENCPYFQAHKNPLFNQDSEEHCRYWLQREGIENSLPSNLLMTPQSLLARPDLVKEYDRVIIDDVDQIFSLFANRINLQRDDLLNWKNNPNIKDGELPEIKSLLLTLLNGLNEREEYTYKEIKEKAVAARGAVNNYLKKEENKRLPHEEVYEREGKQVYPYRLLQEFIQKLARGEPYKLTNHGISFLRPARQLLNRLLDCQTFILDATPNLLLWEWLSDYGFDLNIPELPRKFPPIYQVYDLLHTKDQLEKYSPFINELLDKMGRDKTLVFTRKPEDGMDYPFGAIAHHGRDERGLNQYGKRGFEQMMILGHFQMSTQDAKEQAWMLRTLSKELHISEPEAYYQEEEAEKGENKAWRFFNDPFRRYGRLSWRSEDPLAENLRRHHHSSTMLQASSRLRSFEQPIYLFSGEPLDGLPYDVPVKLISMDELAQKFGLNPPRTKRELSSGLQRRNQIRQEGFEQRVKEGVERLLPWIKENERLPSKREIQSLLASSEHAQINFKLALRVRIELQTLCPKILGVKGELEHLLSLPLDPIEMGATHTNLNILGASVRCTSVLKDSNPQNMIENQEVKPPKIWDKTSAKKASGALLAPLEEKFENEAFKIGEIEVSEDSIIEEKASSPPLPIEGSQSKLEFEGEKRLQVYDLEPKLEANGWQKELEKLLLESDKD